MLNVKLTLAYDGALYHGFQRQINAISIQEVLERTLHRVYGEVTGVTGSGRTDSGVHARGQVVNYYAPFEIPVDRISYALNSVLPYDIRV
ncbi:MAG: tRNA pseudouridine(38-40) synthase TruA, partial [Candidatus Contubernalis sp.]|nr:tRNA pseudouridine(38-40) synthase TruA [Candidatus Contubernalis sp.]